MLAVNKVRARQTPDQVSETFQPLARSNGIETIFAAYDFEVLSSGPYIPKVEDANSAAQKDETDPLPVFFSISDDPNDNPPACISEDRLLSSLPTTLDRGQLFEKFSLALAATLRSVIWEDAFVMLDRDSTAAQRATAKAQHCSQQYHENGIRVNIWLIRNHLCPAFGLHTDPGPTRRF